MLHHHRPILYADSKDRYLQGVQLYGEPNGKWLQYWIAWPGDPDHKGIDYELVMVEVGEWGPVRAVYAQHKGAKQRSWKRVRKEGDRPIVYVERDKHAARFRRGPHRDGWKLRRANGNVRIDLPVQIGLPVALARRQAVRDPDAWVRRVLG